MAFELKVLWLVSALAFWFAAVFSLRNYFLTKRLSNLWLWLSVAMAFIGASRLSNFLLERNPLYQDVTTGLLLVGAVMIVITLFDFEKEVNLCMNCNGSLSDLPKQEKKAMTEKMLKGF